MNEKRALTLREVLEPTEVYEPVYAPGLEFKETEAWATLADVDYAPWFRMVNAYLARLNAVNGRDYTSSVSLAGFERRDGANLKMWRIRWRARTPLGDKFLEGLSLSLRLLPAPKGENQAKDGENPSRLEHGGRGNGV